MTPFHEFFQRYKTIAKNLWDGHSCEYVNYYDTFFSVGLSSLFGSGAIERKNKDKVTINKEEWL
jgi:hypothetical protein